MHFLLFWLMLPPTVKIPEFASLDPNQFSSNPIQGMTSPTTVTALNGKLYLGCDLLDARPGIYRVLSHQGPVQVGLVFHLNQHALEGVSQAKGRLYVASSRIFSPYPEDWRGQVLVLEEQERRTVLSLPVDLLSRCSGGSFECGLIGAAPLDDSWLMVTKQNMAEIHHYTKREGAWTKTLSLPVTVAGRYGVITEFKVVGDWLVFLMRDRWLLSAARIQDVFVPGAWRLNTERVFDLSPLRLLFKISNPGLLSDGFAEGFAFDEMGQLFVVLNNRGYLFDDTPHGKARSEPFLISYSQSATSTK